MQAEFGRASPVPAAGRVLAAVALGAAILFPFAFLLLLSLAEAWPAPDLLPGSLSADRWAEMLGGPLGASMLQSVGVSVAVALLSTLAGFVTGKHIAYSPHRHTLLFLAYVPFVMSPVILGVCLMYLFIKTALVGTFAGVVVSQTIFAYGFAIVFFSAFWNAEIRALEGLVYTLGGTRRQALRRVLLPVAKGMLLVCFFQTFLISWFQYGLTLLVGAGKVQTLPIKVFEYVGEANPYYAALASLLLVLPPALLLWANKRFVFRIEG